MKSKIAFLLTVFLFVLLTPETGNAQSGGQIPPFGMTRSNGQYFRATDIPKGKPVILIYFAPDCDHCHTLMNEFFKRAGNFNAAEVVMVTFKSVNEVAAFEQAYQTFRYPNIRVGTEGNTNFLRLYYKVQTTPFTVLYNKEGKLIASYRKETPLNELLKKLKQA